MRFPMLAPAATVLLTLFAFLATLSGLDRLAERDAGGPGVANWPYAHYVPLNVAVAAAARHDWAAAETMLARAIEADPLNERIIGALGEVRLRAGNATGADAAFRVSVLRGWRDLSTHSYWLVKSVELGDFRSAGLHTDALLRLPLNQQTQSAIISMLLEYDEGRNALATRLRGSPPWAHDFVVDILPVSDAELAARADVISRAQIDLWTCLDTGGMVDRLVKAGSLHEASIVRNASCAAPGKQVAGNLVPGNLVNDGNFARYLAEGRASILDWRAPDDSNITVEAANPSGIRISTSGGVTQTVLSQRIIAPVGRYRLTWKMPGTNPAQAGSLLVDLACEPDLSKAVQGTLVPATSDTYSAEFNLAQGCPLSVLNFWLKPSRQAITIDRVKIERPAS